MKRARLQKPEEYARSAMKAIAANVQTIADEIDYSEVHSLISDIISAHQNNKRVFVMGAGRSGLAAKAFAMRLMHLGLNVYVVGETVTPCLLHISEPTRPY